MGPNVVSFVHFSDWFLFLCGLLLNLEKKWGLKIFQQLLFFYGTRIWVRQGFGHYLTGHLVFHMSFGDTGGIKSQLCKTVLCAWACSREMIETPALPPFMQIPVMISASTQVLCCLSSRRPGHSLPYLWPIWRQEVVRRLPVSVCCHLEHTMALS